jgi:hypothetical protein
MVLLILLSCGFSLGNILLIPYINTTALLVGNVGVWIGLNMWWDRRRVKSGKWKIES